MEIFDDNLKKVVERFFDSSDFELLNYWYLVFDKANESYRDYLEMLFKSLDENTQKDFKDKLCKDCKNFYETINELIVSSYLITLGCSVECEPNIEGKTPDWVIETTDNKKIIIDLFTSNTPTFMQSQSEVVSRLNKRIEKLPSFAILWGKITDAYTALRNIDQLTEDISRWLESAPKLNESFSSYGLSVFLRNYHNRPLTLLALSIDESRRNDLRDLPNKIIDKAEKYENISTNHKMPFVVAIVFDRMIIDEDTVEQYICSYPASLIETYFYYDENGNKVIEGVFAPDGNGGMFQLEDRHDEGVFRKDSLSGVITFWFHSRNFIGTKLFKNPKATFPLPEELDFKTVIS